MQIDPDTAALLWHVFYVSLVGAVCFVAAAVAWATHKSH